MNNHQHQQQDIHHIFVQNENDELDVNNDESNNSESGDFQSDSLPSSEDFQSDLEQSLPSSDDLEQSEDVINDLDKSMDFGK